MAQVLARSRVNFGCNFYVTRVRPTTPILRLRDAVARSGSIRRHFSSKDKFQEQLELLKEKIIRGDITSEADLKRALSNVLPDESFRKSDEQAKERAASDLNWSEFFGDQGTEFSKRFQAQVEKIDAEFKAMQDASMKEFAKIFGSDLPSSLKDDFEFNLMDEMKVLQKEFANVFQQLKEGDLVKMMQEGEKDPELEELIKVHSRLSETAKAATDPRLRQMLDSLKKIGVVRDIEQLEELEKEFASPRMTDDDMFSRTEEEMMKNFDPQAVREKLREMKKSKFGSQQLIERLEKDLDEYERFLAEKKKKKKSAAAEQEQQTASPEKQARQPEGSQASAKPSAQATPQPSEQAAPKQQTQTPEPRRAPSEQAAEAPADQQAGTRSDQQDQTPSDDRAESGIHAAEELAMLMRKETPFTPDDLRRISELTRIINQRSIFQKSNQGNEEEGATQASPQADESTPTANSTSAAPSEPEAEAEKEKEDEEEKAEAETEAEATAEKSFDFDHTGFSDEALKEMEQEVLRMMRSDKYRHELFDVFKDDPRDWLRREMKRIFRGDELHTEIQKKLMMAEENLPSEDMAMLERLKKKDPLGYHLQSYEQTPAENWQDAMSAVSASRQLVFRMPVTPTSQAAKALADRLTGLPTPLSPELDKLLLEEEEEKEVDMGDLTEEDLDLIRASGSTPPESKEERAKLRAQLQKARQEAARRTEQEETRALERTLDEEEDFESGAVPEEEDEGEQLSPEEEKRFHEQLLQPGELDPEDIKLIYDPSSGNRRAIEDALKTKPTDTEQVWHLAPTQVLKYKKLLRIRRHTKITAGGRKYSYSAFVLVGNGDGTGGLGYGRGLKPETATERALRNAYANLITIERYQNRTIMYPVTHRHCRTIVIMRPLAKGSGLRCNALVSDVLTCFGIKDMFVKVTGRRFMPHAFKAIFEVLEKERSPLTIAKGLGKKFFDNNQAHMPRSPYGL